MRSGPREVEPITHEGVTYSVPHGGPRSMGIVVAVDTDTGAELWQQVVYTVEYDHAYETDCQDVYITRLAIQGDELVVRDEGKAVAKRVAILDQHPQIEVPLSQRWTYYEEAGRSQEVCWILRPLLELAGNDPFYDVWEKALKRHQGQATARPSPYELAARRELGELEPAQLEGLRGLLKAVFQGLATGKPEPATLEALSSFLEGLKPLQEPLLDEFHLGQFKITKDKVALLSVAEGGELEGGGDLVKTLVDGVNRHGVVVRKGGRPFPWGVAPFTWQIGWRH